MAKCQCGQQTMPGDILDPLGLMCFPCRRKAWKKKAAAGSKPEVVPVYVQDIYRYRRISYGPDTEGMAFDQYDHSVSEIAAIQAGWALTEQCNG